MRTVSRFSRNRHRRRGSLMDRFRDTVTHPITTCFIACPMVTRPIVMLSIFVHDVDLVVADHVKNLKRDHMVHGYALF
jgi:hypothetical protein